MAAPVDQTNVSVFPPVTQSTLRYLTAPPLWGKWIWSVWGTSNHVAQWRGTKLFSAMYSETCVILVESGVAAVLHHLSDPRCWRTGWCDSLVTWHENTMPHRSLTPYQKTNAKGRNGPSFRATKTHKSKRAAPNAKGRKQTHKQTRVTPTAKGGKTRAVA